VSPLRQLVQEYVTGPAATGERVGSQRSAFDREWLRKELERRRRSTETLLWVCTTCLLVLFALLIVGLITYREKPDMFTRISTAGGVTIVGVVTILIGLWKQKVKFDLVTALVGGAPENVLKIALAPLLKEL
jgi:hypothetical protein